nr:glycosyltransferase [Stutzerimonas nitrititolerans]
MSYLAETPFFSELEFRMIGDGPLFDEILEPLRKYPNVIIERRFLKQREISELHKEYGVFLCPTRMDAQGVSRDEAMASGLIPITNAVAAIPEFVDDGCGYLAGAEDYIGLANAISEVYGAPHVFEKLSSASARRVRHQTSSEIVIDKECRLIKAH